MTEDREPKPASSQHVDDVDGAKLEAAQSLGTHHRQAMAAMNSLVVKKVAKKILKYETNNV